MKAVNDCKRGANVLWSATEGTYNGFHMGTMGGPASPSMVQRWHEFRRRVNVRYLDAWTMGCTFVHGRVVFPFFFPFLVHRAHVGAGACLPLSQVEDNALYSVDGRLFWPDLEAYPTEA